MAEKKRARGRPVTIGASQAITMMMTPGLVTAMDRIAAETGVTRSAVARLLIEEALANRSAPPAKAKGKAKH